MIKQTKLHSVSQSYISKNSKNEHFVIQRITFASLHIYIVQKSDINVKACGCDSLYGVL